MCLPGCVKPAMHGGVPDDFSLDLAVLPAAGAPNDAAQHFILHADGSLRAGRGPMGSHDTYPGQARRLSADQVAQLVGLSRRAVSAAEAGGPTHPSQWLREQRSPNGEVVLLWVRDSGDERAARFETVDGLIAPPALDVLFRLRELALMR